MRMSASVSLGKHDPPKARPRMQRFAADAAVQPDAARHAMHIGADLLAQIRHFIDEGDLHRQEAVGGVFDQLRRLHPVNTIGVSIR